MVLQWDAYNWDEFPLELIKRGHKKRGNKKYLKNYGAFDIETTNIDELLQSVMYIWQFQIDETTTIIGRTWEEFQEFFQELNNRIPNDAMYVVLVHNLSFEFQFLKSIIEFQEVKAMDKRKILTATSGKVEFRCTYLHSNMSLRKYLEKMGVEHQKTELDYDKRRYSDTELTEKEIEYCVNDVQGLHEAYGIEMERDGDDLYTIPLTSTGYIRREAKEALAGYKQYIQQDLPDAKVFTLLREAFRGGNTHANRWNANILINAEEGKPIMSYDISSSYPADLLTQKFPRKFYPGRIENFELYLEQERACLFRIKIYDLKLLDHYWGIPYLSKDKCRHIFNGVYDNGRILKADSLDTTLTEVDFAILLSEYEFDYVITELYTARKEKLSRKFRDLILQKYKEKTKLKDVDDYKYMKEKNKFNAIYGMTVQNPCKDEWLWNGKEMVRDDSKTYEQRVEDYQEKGWLNYSTGVWTTAYARLKLEQGIACLPPTAFLYSDTDSIKFIGDYSKEFEDLNKEYMDEQLSATDVKGNRHYIGVFEREHTKTPILSFKTLGAKKYCYTDSEGLHLTLSGVAKEKGAEELQDIDNFAAGFVFHEGAGIECRYNDTITYADIDGHHLKITSNIYIGVSTYHLSLGEKGDYRRLLNYLSAVDIKHVIMHNYDDIMEDKYE